LQIGNTEFEAEGDPNSGIGKMTSRSLNIFTLWVRAKACSVVAKAIEDIFGNTWTVAM
jgi:hypothetical protein